MSDAANKHLKVSREGIVLIKSFEGFRPRAIQRADGGWIIGYGHTLSAREGATVSEPDAELLLRYDLLPVEASIRTGVAGSLNQHQFDALVSFALSVGLDRFAGSDVLQRLSVGASGEAAEAIMGWPEPPLPEMALRRRAAERALFIANPSTPVALSDLLSAPLPSPPVPAAVVPIRSALDTPEEFPAVGASAEDVHAPAPVDDKPKAIDSRGAAVAALLGERTDRVAHPETIIPDFGTGPIEEASQEAAVEQVSDVPLEAEPVAPGPIILGSAVATAAIATAAASPLIQPIMLGTDTPASDQEPAVKVTPPSTNDVPASTEFQAVSTPEALNNARYMPYGAPMVGPLPDLAGPGGGHAGQAALDEAAPVQTAPEAEVEPMVDRASTALPQTEAFAAPAATELVLTPFENGPEPALSRPAWSTEERDTSNGSENSLFGEDLNLTRGGSILRNDIEVEAPARFDWKETGPFIFMGGLGLVSFGASMAAFRRAAEQSGGGDLTIIGWALALIGLGCVGVSSVNLYRRFGHPGAD